MDTDARTDAEAPAEAFASLSDPVRVEILLALWDEVRRGPVAFSDLKATVGVRDSGRFTYHLKQLRDGFVEKTDEGYQLTTAGLLVVDAVEAGTFTDAPSRPPVDAGVDCPHCEGELVVGYDEGMFRVRCGGCGTDVGILAFPPRGVQVREGEDLLAAFAARGRRLVAMAGDGVCPFCGGRMAVSLAPNEDLVLGDDDGDHPHIAHPVTRHCRECDGLINSTLGFHLLDHPAVVSFLYDHGVNARERPFWEFPFCIDDAGVDLRSESPVRATQTVERDGERLVVTVDGDASVVETARVR